MGTKQVKRGWGCTCPNCPWVPPRPQDDEEIEPDYVRIPTVLSKITGEPRSIALGYPVRCSPCHQKMKRITRMRRRLNRLWEESFTFFGPKRGFYSKPKLITFALPSENSYDYEEREVQKNKLRSLMPEARKLLREHGILGGTYVIECTSRLVEPKYGLMMWKHHAHIHMVALAPWVPPKYFSEYCTMLMPIGLGRVNYKSPRDKLEVASYISKYLTKEKTRSVTFGCMRGLPGSII